MRQHARTRQRNETRTVVPDARGLAVRRQQSLGDRGRAGARTRPTARAGDGERVVRRTLMLALSSLLAPEDAEGQAAAAGHKV